MKKLLLIFLLLFCGVAMGQTWQPADPNGIIYSEYNTGTYITLTQSSIKIVTTPEYTSVTEPVRFTFVVYDSIGHFVEKFDQSYPDVRPEVCEKMYDYLINTSGSFLITIYGTMKYQGIMSYSIEDYTYQVCIRYQEYLKSILR